MNISPIKSTYNVIGNNIQPKVKNAVTNPVKNSSEVMSAAAASAIAAATMVKTSDKLPSETEIKNKLLQSGYVENKDRNCFVRKNHPQNDLKLYEELYGRGSDVYLSNVMELPADKITDFKKFLEMDPKLGAKMYNKHFDSLLTIFCNLKFNGQIPNLQDKNFYKMITNIIVNMPNDETIKAFNQYKGKVYEEGVAKDAQKYLREKQVNPNAKADEKIEKFINTISSYIDTQKIPAGTKLYRGERFYILNNVKTQNGETVDLGKMMQEAAQSKDYNSIKKIKEFIQDNEITATQPAFMSVSMDSINDFERKGWIHWELETEPDTKGVYLDGINTSFYTFQQEALLQKGSKIKISDAEYDASREIWHIKGKVSN